MAGRMHLWILLVGMLYSGSVVRGQQDLSDVEVVIVGAGVAGLSAAKTLQDQGITNIQILEATGGVGGRLKSSIVDGKTVELGAHYFRKASDSDPIWLLVQRAQLDTEEESFESYGVFDKAGNDVTDDADTRYDILYQDIGYFDNLTYQLEIEEPFKPDISQRKALQRGGWRPQNGIDDAIEYFDFDFEYGHSPDTASTRHSYIPGDHDVDEYVVLDQTSGAKGIATVMAGDITDFQSKLRTDTKVTKIQYSSTGVTVTIDSGEWISADYVIVTCSLGVLKFGELEFTPKLPEWKSYSITGSTFANEVSVYFKFPPTANIPDVNYLLYAGDRRGYFTIWQNFNVFWPGTNIIRAILSGSEARRAERMADADLVTEATAVLRNMLGSDFPDPVESVVSNWWTDPLFRGSYSDWSPDFSVDSHEALGAPVERVYFAGEAYNKEWFGYVHGAYYSGNSTAWDIIRCASDDTKCRDYVAPYEARGCTYPSAENYDAEAVTDDGSCRFRPSTTNASFMSRESFLSHVIVSTLWAVFVLLNL